MSAVEWTPERIKVLMGLWEEGLPTSEIGRRLGVTKNAVVGKVHRLGLKKRQSPIRKSSNRQPLSNPSSRETAGKGTVGAKKAKSANAPSQPQTVTLGSVAVNPSMPRVVPANSTRPSGVLVQMEELTSTMCCWPEGEPGTSNFHFCAKPSLAEKPYCAEHCERAYVKVSKHKKSKGFEAA